MTGTGTENDPYKPETWSELISVSISDNVYIELPSAAGVFDMNNIYPEGITDTITLKGHIKGNDWAIRNASYRGGSKCFEIGTSLKEKLHFLNCYALLTGGYFIGTSNSIPSGANVFSQCKFSGRVSASGPTTPYFSWIGRQAAFYRCSLNVILENTMLDYAMYRYCNINAKITGSQGSGYLQLDNSYLTGKIDRLQMQRYSNNYVGDSVIDCTISDSVVWDSGTPQHLLINSDKVASGITIPSALTSVTTSQLKDAEYLSSIGFPIQT